VNNVPLLIVGGVLVVFVILVAMVASQRGEQEEAEPAVSAGMLPENSQLLDQMLANGALAGLVARCGCRPHAIVSRCARVRP